MATQSKLVSPQRTPEKVRTLTAADLGIELAPEAPREQTQTSAAGHPGDPTEVLADDDPILLQVAALRSDGYGGVILRGPPGTSKSWYAKALAGFFAGGNRELVRTVQFHPSYQYEDFVEGFVPKDGGGFELTSKHLLVVSDLARERPAEVCVLVIDELSRADAARVFGEALTYIEQSKRGIEFALSSGRLCALPANLFIIGTMNEFDRGVDQIDAAFERRLGYVVLDPDVDLLQAILIKNQVPEAFRKKLSGFFEWLQHHPNRYCRIGHAYFDSVRDSASLRRLWEHQLRFVFERAFAVDQQQGLDELRSRWDRLVEELEDTPEAPPDGDDSASPIIDEKGE